MTLCLSFGLCFDDLYRRDGLHRVDQAFMAFLEERSDDLARGLQAARQSCSLDKKQESDLLVALAPYVDDFVGTLFEVSGDLAKASDAMHELAPVYRVKRNFVQRLALKKHDAAMAQAYDGAALEARLGINANDEGTFARAVEAWLNDETAAHANLLEQAAQYAAWAAHTDAGRQKHKRGVLFKYPQKINPQHLVPVRSTAGHDGQTTLQQDGALRFRDGFGLTDAGADTRFALDQTHYCIKCHDRGKDSCRTGIRDKESEKFVINDLGNELAGCPLDQKISEMNVAFERGHLVGALAIVCVDNPMVAATGHRICNDCMKACIFQKQEPVDIPQIETRILKNVLALPYGFELYSLLTRWNPLDIKRPLPREETGYKVLVVGMGPAGFTLAHHLMNDGHAVVGVDGLKIEPLAVPFEPVRDINTLYETLDDRVLAGFGGVAEYGITVRWDKNFLKLIRLLLERRSQFRLFGGVRFGGTLSIDQAFADGFDHIALCAGAGKPTVLDIPNGLAKGVRAASDFLMALQLTGAAKSSSVASLQIRLPVVVIGGGLTAVDAATEALAYYPQQVEKFSRRYHALCALYGETHVRATWTAEDNTIAEEFLWHARQLHEERARAAAEQRSPDLLSLLRRWGGVSVVYRRAMTQAPSYRLNHEEVTKAFEEGLQWIENRVPQRVDVDVHGWVQGLLCADALTGEAHEIKARTILIAAGTHPNTVIAREDGRLTLNGDFFEAIDDTGQVVVPERSTKPSRVEVIMHRRADGRAISYFGDMHPSFTGKVVKAMGSAKQGYPLVSRHLHTLPKPLGGSIADFLTLMAGTLQPRVAMVEDRGDRLRLQVYAPQAARAWQSGQFFRLQNYEALSLRTRDTVLAMEGVALTPVAVDAASGLITFYIMKTGGSADLAGLMQPGDPVILMGPTGQAPDVSHNGAALVILSDATAMSMVALLRKIKEDNNKLMVVELLTSKRASVQTMIGDSGNSPITADHWVTCTMEMLLPTLQQLQVDKGTWLKRVDTIYVSVAPKRLGRVQDMLRHQTTGLFRTGVKMKAAVHSPMQCMMKEVCAQCLQSHTDPVTGKKDIVFSCVNPLQSLWTLDVPVLGDRLEQNALSEKLNVLWIRHCLEDLEKIRAA